MSSTTAKKVAELGPWAEAFSFEGVQTVAPKRFLQLEQRTLARRSLFMDPLIKSGALEDKRVLDLGCNAGYWTLAAMDGGARFVTGVDTDKKRIDQAHFVMQQHGISGEQYEFVYQDVYQYLSSVEQGFDVVLCLGLFYHIEHPIRLMRLMAKATRELAVIDTVVSNVPQASVSIRPCARKKRYLDVSNIGLEFVSSPKAIHWMAFEAGFQDIATLEYEGKRLPAMWEYTKGERRAFVAARGDASSIRKIFSNASSKSYLHPREDHEKYGQSPEKRGIVREDEQPSIRQRIPSNWRADRFWALLKKLRR